MTRRGSKVDANQAAVVADLRALGWSVLDTSGAGDGFPDVVVGIGGRLPAFAPAQNVRGVVCDGEVYMVEIKSPGGKLRPAQQELAWTWRGNYIVAETAEDVVEAIQALRRGKAGAR